MLRKLWNWLLLRTIRAKKAIKKIADCLGPEFTEEMLAMILKCMSLFFYISDKYRKNIEGFEGRYIFRSDKEKDFFAVSAIFRKGKMKVREGLISKPNIVIRFKNSSALINFIFSPKPDVLNAILKQEVKLEGNLNYLYKFAYMANQLRMKGLELL